MIRRVSSIAEDLRRETRIVAGARSAEERLRLALELGDSDLLLYRAGDPSPVEEARRALERQRGRGRRRSACAQGR